MSWSFDKNTLNNTTIGGKKTTFKGKHNKLLFVSFAMIKALVWNDIFSRTKLAKATMKIWLEKNDRIYTLLRIKPYFHKWHIISNFIRNQILKSKDLVIKKAKEEQKRIILVALVTKNDNEDNYINKTIINENDITSSELEIKL